MEVAMNLLSSSPPPFPLRTQLRNGPTSPSSCASLGFNPLVAIHASMTREQASTAVSSSMPTTSMPKHFPMPLQLDDHHDDSMPSLRMLDESIDFLSTSKWNQIETRPLTDEDGEYNTDQLLKDFQHQLLRLPGLSSLFPSLSCGESPSLTMEAASATTKQPMNSNSFDAVSLAIDSLSFAKEAVSLVEISESVSADCDESFIYSVTSVLEVKTVRSTRHLERQAKKRKVSRPKVVFKGATRERSGLQQQLSQGDDANDPLKLFLRDPESKKLLTLKEESRLLGEIQVLNKLEEARKRLHFRLDREPTLVEWAEAVGKSCWQLQSELHSGNRSREKLISSNLLMVVHISKQYRGIGLSFGDLLQAGSIGLIKSVDKYKPQAAARFATYAYWWIRQSVRLAIHRNSRIIQLPERIYDLQRKVKLAKKSYIQEFHHRPTNEQLAQHLGITVQKLRDLQFLTRATHSLDQPVWTDQNTTLQEITADTGIENPELSVAKQLMRKHVLRLLNSLNPKEKQVMKLRYGIGYSKQYSLREIGAAIKLSSQRIHQIEIRAMEKLKESLGTDDLEAYVDFLV